VTDGRSIIAPVAPPADAAGARVLVLSAEVGEGHRAAARALAAELAEDWGVEAVHEDGLAAMGRLPRLMISDIYRSQLRHVPWLYGIQYVIFARFSPARWLGRAFLRLAGARGLRRLIERHEPDVIVSTYPAVNAVLGHLRLRGRVEAPVCAAILDHGDFEFWAHRGIDLHLVMYDESIVPVERLSGPGGVRRSRPPIGSQFFRPRPRADARRALDLPESGELILITGGGWGVGDLEGAVRGTLEIPGATLVCLTGRDEHARRHLEAAFAGDPRVRVLGFTSSMSDLLAAADAIVLSSGGVTCLEALVRGCPIVTYGSPPGHARANARALASLGLVRDVRSPGQIPDAVRAALGRPAAERPCLAPAPSPTSLLMNARPRVSVRRTPRTVVARVAVAGALALATLGLSTDEPYPVAARVLRLDALTSVRTARPAVSLVVRTPPGLVANVSRHLEHRGEHASFALRESPDPRQLAGLDRAGQQALPELPSGALTRWVRVRNDLERQRAFHPVLGRIYYVPPRSGFTLGQYALARTLGARPVGGPDRPVTATRRYRPGEIVVMTVDPRRSGSVRRLDTVLERLSAQGLSAVTLDDLLSPGLVTEPTSGDLASVAAPASSTRTKRPIGSPPSGVAAQLSPVRSGASSTATRMSSTRMMGPT
jgi:processive 1,2-diacylglycerol beta-glucosyltransferase